MAAGSRADPVPAPAHPVRAGAARGRAGAGAAAATVLVVTDRFDVTADFVVAELGRRGVPVFRLDPSEFPTGLTVAATLGGRWTGSLRTARRSLDLDDVGCVYYRKPAAFRFPAGMTEADRAWAMREARIGFGGLLAALPHWLDHPRDIAAAELKPAQLAAAERAGLRVPRTLLTNDPAAARRFVAETRRAVYKPLSGPVHVEGGRNRFLYTSLVDAADLAGGDADGGIGLTAHLFQEWVPKQFEVRLTAVDGRLFAARIDAGSDRAAIDWRADYAHLSYRTTAVPADVARAVGRLLGAFGLRFGALDFVVTPADDWVFLELNPNGQWAWIEERTGLPIAAAIADALQERRPPP